MTASDDTPRDLGPSADTFRDDLRAATSLLEQVIADRSRLVHVPFEERQRFLDAVGHVFHPDARARRSMVKATTKQGKLDALREAQLHVLSNPDAVRGANPAPNDNPRTSPEFWGAFSLSGDWR